ncbi:MAG: hypothetical protein DWI26_00100 [Planctomycetota bacterium]|nr:MAG: hypothetical protein DWI26_00100 [Planctomycetota bacterium]
MAFISFYQPSGFSSHYRRQYSLITETDQATWAKLSITVERSDGGSVDAEIIRPRFNAARVGAPCYGSVVGKTGAHDSPNR